MRAIYVIFKLFFINWNHEKIVAICYARGVVFAVTVGVHQTVPRFYTGKLQAVQAQPQFTITYFISIYNIKI